MECIFCSYVNREGARFCARCATPLAELVTCPGCGASHAPGTAYCDRCGRALDERLRPPRHLAAKILAGRGALEDERKQVTVLFADVTGSMELAERSDPEEWRRLMDHFVSILCAGVHRFEGTVDKFTGDGVMALFGAPVAHEDHARRACYAALHLREALAAYAEDLRRQDRPALAVRIGLNSGEVVVGAVGQDLGMAYTAVGHTVGLAQRMEQLAQPGSIYVSDRTASLVDGYVTLADRGDFAVKGVRRPMRVYELTGVGVARGRLDVVGPRGLGPFVGRGEELAALERALEQAFAGHGQVVGVVGEPGVGKSRLCHEFAERHRAQGTQVYRVAAQAHAKALPLVPVLQLLRAYFSIDERDAGETVRERIAARLALLDERFEEELPLIFDFLAAPDPERPLPKMDPDAARRELLTFLKRLTRANSARQPAITVIEDLHWLDPASEVFLANQVEAVQGTRSLVVLNFRPEYRATWMSRSCYSQISLPPLAAENAGALVADLLGSDASVKGLGQVIAQRAQGNPFFIEELVQALVDGGSLQGERASYRLAAPVEESGVPPTVQATLAARIDRLDRRDKAVLQAAAVIGKEVPEPVLARVVALDPSELEDAVRELRARGLLVGHDLYPEAVYAFKHPLTREVAYASQLSDRRAAAHAAAAHAIAEQYAENLDERAALVAQHWDAAGERLEAARWHARAGAWLVTRTPTQAAHHWERVRDRTDGVPESAETSALALASRMFLLQLGWRLGSTSPEEAEQLFLEAESIARAAGDVRSRAMLLSGYGAMRGTSDGDVREDARLLRIALCLAEEVGDPALYVAIAPIAYALFCTGEYREAIAVYDRAVELAADDPTLGSGINIRCPSAFCSMLKGFVMAETGELGESRRLLEHASALGREQGDVEVVGWSHDGLSWLSCLRGDLAPAVAHARAAVEIAERFGDPFSRAHAWYFLGLSQRIAGEWRLAIEALERSRAIARETRSATENECLRLAVLGECMVHLGDLGQARELVERGAELARSQGQPTREAIARLALARTLQVCAGAAAHAEIEAALARARDLTCATGARAFTPQVHLELAELARQDGDEQACERELREAHRLFTEIGATGHAQRLEREHATIVGP